MSKILVIEDEPNLLQAMKNILLLEGFEVLTAADGDEGLKVLHSDTPSLILCDIMMPKMSGYEVIKEVKADPKTSTIPFVFLSAKSENEDVQKGLALGADNYLTKPFQFDELNQILSIVR